MNRYLPAAQTVARLVPDILTQRGLAPVVSRYILTETPTGAAWLFVVLDAGKIARIEAYTSKETLHQLSTALKGRPVVLSNTTGLRYGVLLSPPPAIPREIAFPGWRSGLLQVGQGPRGEAITTAWADLGHVLVAGMTGSGKSNFLRLLVAQAIAEGHALALADPDGRTFPQLAGRPELIAPVGQTLDGCRMVVDAAQEEIGRRSRLFTEAEGYPDSLEAYNAVAGSPLPRLLIVVDEFNGLTLATGGPKAGLAQAVTQIAWRGRKFGATLVLAGQDFTKEIVGSCRDQLTTRVCFRVANEATSRVVLGQTGAERLKTAGRAWSNVWGLLQTYRAELTVTAQGDGLTKGERLLAGKLIEGFGGRMTYDALGEMGYSKRQAEKLRRDWLARGLAESRPEEDNALCVKIDRFAGPTGQTDQAGETEKAE